MNTPNELRYTKDHEWIKNEDNLVVVGITDYAQGELGDIVFIDIEVAIGDTVEQGEVFGSVEAVKTVSDLFMPITGKLVEVNEQLEDQPELVNSDAYGDGWMIKIEPSDMCDVDSLLVADDYQGLIA